MKKQKNQIGFAFGDFELFAAESAQSDRGTEEELKQCADCGRTWPVSEFENGVCPDCLLKRDNI